MTGPLAIGIDPGLTGAVSLVADRLLEVADLPVLANGSASGSMRQQLDAGAFDDLLRDWSRRHDFAGHAVVAAIERPIAMPRLPAQTIAVQFDTYGVLRGVLAARRLVPLAVDASKWKRGFGLKGGKDEKAASRQCAARLYPGAPVDRVKDHNRAESILIAHWARRQFA